MSIGPTQSGQTEQQLTAELIESYGFEPTFFRDNPVTHAAICSVIDRGDPVTAWAMAWELTGDRIHLPVDIAMEGLGRVDGWVTEAELQEMGQTIQQAAGTVAVEEMVTLHAPVPAVVPARFAQL